MSILRPAIQFAQALPIVAPQRRRTLAQPSFYTDSQQQQDQQNQELERPTSEDYISQQLQKIAGRSAPPLLQPGSRVKNVDSSQADPNNFKGYYDRLNMIDQIGKEQLAAAQAQAQVARLRASQQVSNSVGGPGNAATPKYNVGSVGNVPSNPAANFQFAKNIAGNYGWNNDAELAAWYKLGMNESGWRNNAQNPNSTAYGIGQFLNQTWGGYGIPKTSDPALQVEAMARYIKARYGTPSRALSFWYSHNPHFY